ncbi:MAG: Gfo/Idh/MocA family oxidoreductase [Lentisphaeria bacterium]|nr:Gfo/Idh/MocA family oxidoreductase [Lentisphaeria bacterium]
MAEEVVKFGFFGAGSIAIYRHACEIKANPWGEVVAIYDPIAERAEWLAEQYGAKVVDSEEELLAIEEIEAIVVATPNCHHARLTIAALEAGKHVLCEKPMATSLEDAKKMIATAEKTGKKLMIGHNQRLMPPHIKARELIQAGAIGDVLSFRTSFGHGGPETWSQDNGPHTWFFRKEMAFVGTMGDLGVHKTDLIRWLLDSEVEEVGAFVDTLAKKNEKDELITVDDNAVCILRMANGAMGQLTASWTYGAAEDNITVIYGTKGQMVLGANPDFPVEISLTNGEQAQFKVGAVATNEVQVPSGIPDEFIDCILDDEKPSISGEEGLKALAIVIACLKSSESKKIVKVEY